MKWGQINLETGLVSLGKCLSCKGGIRWATPEKFEQRRKASLAIAKRPETRERIKLQRNTDERRAKRSAYNKIRNKRPEVRKRLAEAARLRRRQNAQFNVRERVRARVRDALRYAGATKGTSTIKILGCSWPKFQEHLQSKFLPGMSWDNRALWHIDHAVPLSTASTEAEAIALCHFSNLQPLWALDNQRKGNRLHH